MPITVDCGENKHDLCTGRGRTAYLIPQESRALDEEPFNCGCTCHHAPDPKVPCRECQPLVGEETFGGVVLTDHVIGGLAEEAERGYDITNMEPLLPTIPSDRRLRVAHAILPFVDIDQRSEATDHQARSIAWEKALKAADAVLALPDPADDGGLSDR